MLAACGMSPSEDPDVSRKLIIATERDDVELIVVRASDVPTYVKHGAADLGVAGKDVLMEDGGEGVYELLDLGIARCRLMLAGPQVSPGEGARRRERVATKYVNCTRHYYAQQGKQVEIIKLYGSMELGPLVGLSDYIVDLVDTGNTLRANGLEPLEHIADISARLIVNKASMKMKHAAVTATIDQLRGVLQ